MWFRTAKDRHIQYLEGELVRVRSEYERREHELRGEVAKELDYARRLLESAMLSRGLWPAEYLAQAAQGTGTHQQAAPQPNTPRYIPSWEAALEAQEAERRELDRILAGETTTADE